LTSRPRRSATTTRPRWPWSAHASGRRPIRGQALARRSLPTRGPGN
jgi:hypothetical protein